jgi:hypothetical protein
MNADKKEICDFSSAFIRVHQRQKCLLPCRSVFAAMARATANGGSIRFLDFAKMPCRHQESRD